MRATARGVPLRPGGRSVTGDNRTTAFPTPDRDVASVTEATGDDQAGSAIAPDDESSGAASTLP